MAILSAYGKPGRMPQVGDGDYEAADVPVGDDASFWLIGRDANLSSGQSVDQITFSLVDEASKLNLNRAPVAMIQSLPNMTAESRRRDRRLARSGQHADRQRRRIDGIPDAGSTL